MDITDEKKEGKIVSRLGAKFDMENPYNKKKFIKGEPDGGSRENCFIIFIKKGSVKGIADVNCDRKTFAGLCQVFPVS